MTTTDVKPVQYQPCSRCNGRMFIDRETEEKYCIACGHRPEWNNVLSYASGNTSIDYMGGVRDKKEVRQSTAQKKKYLKHKPFNYSPPEGGKDRSISMGIYDPWRAAVMGEGMPLAGV